MDINAYKDQIRLELTGYLLDLEIDDATLDKIVNSALREIQRYICTTKIMTIPYTDCIDLSDAKNTNGEDVKISSIVRIFRSNGTSAEEDTMDPIQVAQWQMLSGMGNLANMQDYMYNYMSWNTLGQIRNTSSTDLAFRYDKPTNKLYINISNNRPTTITVEYIPRFDSVDEITSDYWIDILMRYSVAMAKVIVGRIRSRYTQTNALWAQDTGILQEGQAELQNLRDYLQANCNLCYPID